MRVIFIAGCMNKRILLSKRWIRHNIRATFTIRNLTRHPYASCSSNMAKYNCKWQQTMLRIKDPKKSLPFYQDILGMTLVDKYNFEKWNFSLYFMAHVPTNTKLPEPGTEEAHRWLWNTDLVTLELTHNHGTEDKDDFKHNNGNVEPHRGFGHIAMLTDDVYAATEEMLAKGVQFQKKPDEGRMKGLAFALDPDGYWIEIIKRADQHNLPGKFNLAQTMIRVKDAKKSLQFYRDFLGMRVLWQKDFEGAKFSLYMLAHHAGDLSEGASNDEGYAYMKKMFSPVLELTHNWGTEDQEDFHYHNGNTEEGGKGFGHTGYLVDNLEEFCKHLEEDCKVPFKKRPHEGNMRGLAFAVDPDGYWVELIQRGSLPG